MLIGSHVSPADDPQLLVAAVNAAGAPVICQTTDEGRKIDSAFVREQLG